MCSSDLYFSSLVSRLFFFFKMFCAVSGLFQNSGSSVCTLSSSNCFLRPARSKGLTYLFEIRLCNRQVRFHLIELNHFLTSFTVKFIFYYFIIKIPALHLFYTGFLKKLCQCAMASMTFTASLLFAKSPHRKILTHFPTFFKKCIKRISPHLAELTFHARCYL